MPPAVRRLAIPRRPPGGRSPPGLDPDLNWVKIAISAVRGEIFSAERNFFAFNEDSYIAMKWSG
jgi:hypothetical protein